jgi:hypothetical protein
MGATHNLTTKCFFHVKKKDIYLEIAWRKEKGVPPR